VCRKSGLEKRRRCGWLGIPTDERMTPVWVRKDTALATCPKSYVTAESEALLENFLVRKRLGGSRFGELSARETEAFVILERALEEEKTNGHHNPRRTV
jgi:hypothetical protein